jgi:hypothetical protein
VFRWTGTGVWGGVGKVWSVGRVCGSRGVAADVFLDAHIRGVPADRIPMSRAPEGRTAYGFWGVESGKKV